jgi:YegS/Rv2252/BmrU family lipid kinase
MKWFVLVNPTSGNGKGGKKWPKIEAALKSQGIPFDFAISTHAGHIVELVRQAIAKGYRHFAAVGGDGTAHELVNGIFGQQEVPPNEITFALIPVGTGNDWIRAHHIPRNIEQAVQLLQQGHAIMHDIGEIHYTDKEGRPAIRYFINVAGLGYDAFVTRAAHSSARWMGDKLFYLFLAIRCLSLYKPTHSRIVYDAGNAQGSIYSIAIGICPYNGGGARFVPQANPCDGLLALTFFQNINAWHVIKNTPKFYDGTIGRVKQATAVQSRQVQIFPIGEPLPLEADGEFIGHAPASFSILHQALRVMVAKIQ